MADLEGGTTLSLDRHLGASDTAEAIKSYTEIEIPESLRDNLVLFLRMERKVLKEYDPAVCALFDRLFNSMIRANEGNPGTVAADEPTDARASPRPTPRARGRSARPSSSSTRCRSTKRKWWCARSRRSSIWRTCPRRTTVWKRCASWSATCRWSRPWTHRTSWWWRTATCWTRWAPNARPSCWVAWNSTPCSPRTPLRRAAKR